MEDLMDDRATLVDSVNAIQATLNTHTAIAPAVAVQITMEQIEMEIDDLNQIKPRIEDLKMRTRRVFRGKPAEELQTALKLNEDLSQAWKAVTLQCCQIKTSLESSSVSRVKIPKAEPPSFDGQSANWPAFLDQFNSMVVNSPKISSTDKLILLKKSLEKGSAHAIVQNFPLTDLDWTNAWEAVKYRYDHKRELCYAYLSKIFNLTPMTYQHQDGIRNIIDTVNDCTRALHNLKINTDSWDPILIFIIRKNLDYRTRTDFEKTLTDDNLHSLRVIVDYLNTLATALGATNSKPMKTDGSRKQSGATDPANTPQNSQPAEQQRVAPKTQKKTSYKCSFCNLQHFNEKCPTLTPLTPAQRQKLAGEKNLCKNCLRPSTPSHTTSTCRSIPCGVNGCTGMHHQLLHFGTGAAGSKAGAQTLISSDDTNPGAVLLSTAHVIIVHMGQSHKVRALIDYGSQINIITEKLANKLQLPKKPSTTLITGIGKIKSDMAHRISSVKLSSCVDSTWETHVNCYVLSEITENKPNQAVDISNWTQLRNLRLADETFNQPGPVEMLLGIQFFLDILGTHHLKGNPTALETKLGYIIGGEIDIDKIQCQTDPAQTSLTCSVDFDLTRFWNQEEVPEYSLLSPIEREVEENYAQTHEYSKEQRKFIVELPFVPDHKPLGESRNQAMNRMIQLEKRLERNQEKKALYHKAMLDYITEGSLQKIKSEDCQPRTDQMFYLPHHFVEKESSTTKLRVVFDGSAKSSTGMSLNDVLRVGPTLQPNLVTTLSRFREHKIVFSADIKKMYLQIGVKRKHQDFLRVLWRERPEDPICDYRFTCVPFGLASSPYLAMKTLQQLAENEEKLFPLGAAVLKNDFYVDDCFSGASNINEALEKQQQLIEITKKGGFHICKWSSNHPALLESIAAEDREIQLPLDLNSAEKIKTLGILWDPASDCFTFKVTVPTESEITKRMVASYAAKTYDPTGLVQPVVIKAKIILQELWESKVGWDESIPSSIKTDWLNYVKELPNLEKIQIPRHVLVNDPIKIHLHGFSDASSKALGAVIYVVGESADGKISSRLLTSKSKVAPLRMVSIPRLELMGAVLLTKLMKNVKSTFKSEVHETYYWSDSTSVLGQIKKASRRFKTFVGNRVSYIQEYSEVGNWNHVKSEENPADLLSRGVFPSELIGNDFWWKGPPWLETRNLPIGPVPDIPADVDMEELPEVAVLTTAATNHWADGVLKNFNSLTKLKRVTVLILRKFRSDMDPKPRKSTLMSVQELDMAMKTWIRVVQAQSFDQEIRWLKTEKEFPKGNIIKSLNPFLDHAGILRVGGRLENADDLPEEMKHPAILPKNHKLVTMIIAEAHEKYKHAQSQLLTATISSQFWIIGLKSQVRRYIKNCITCQKVTAQIGTQMMGNLPKARISQTRAFLHTGVDFAGPIKVLPRVGRGQKSMKCWIAVFVCFTTKAVHLELVTELSTAAFMAALRRFVSRRGKPQVMYSDEGTNFVGARNEMITFQQEMEAIANHYEVARSLAEDGISWKLNPPGAPHMGGLWEAAVKSMKRLLRRTLNSTNFTVEEVSTLLCEIEACLNSRPLTPMSTDPSDFSVLTPGHFLIGEPLLSVPGPDFTNTKINRLERFERIQQQMTHFWNRWTKEYLHTLQNRPKWNTPSPNFKVGDLVLIKDEAMAPMKWKTGRIIECHPGRDALVRVATVRTITTKILQVKKGMDPLDRYQAQESILKRPIHKLVRLPYDNEPEDPISKEGIDTS